MSEELYAEDRATAIPESVETSKDQAEAEAEAAAEAAEENMADAEAADAAFADWLEEMVPESERRDAAKAAFETVKNSMKRGDFNETIFEMIAKASDYERAVATASEEGEIRGRNTTIDNLYRAEECDDDGVPHPGAGAANGSPKRSPSIFDLARTAH